MHGRESRAVGPILAAEAAAGAGTGADTEPENGFTELIQTCTDAHCTPYLITIQIKLQKQIKINRSSSSRSGAYTEPS